jgi:hypothetical protein
MGSGKTSAGINMINSDMDNKYIFITPFLKEVERIKSSCPNKKFKEPVNHGEGKLKDLHDLLISGKNIASTHALFKVYSDETIDILSKSDYILVLDEVVDVLEHIPLHKDDIKHILNKGLAHVNEDNLVVWDDLDYNGDRFDDIKLMALNKNLLLIDNKLMLWYFPAEIFKCFKTVYILTYMFEAQIQRCYYDLNGIKYKKIGVDKINGVYVFSENNAIPSYVNKLKNKIHILEDKNYNSVGDNFSSSLSYSWFERDKKTRDKKNIKKLKSNIENLFKHRYKSKSSDNMWTVFMDFKQNLCGNGYTKGFVALNARATNDFKNKKFLAYCVNRFLNPYLKNYFIEHGIDVYEDEYALSEMIQWIWRSAIRDGKEIFIYIPSIRMRKLLIGWIDRLSKL